MSFLTDSEILDWMERNHTLHYSVETTYVVDGYLAQIVRDGNVVVEHHGETLREAYAGLMCWEFNIETRRMEKVR
jgi:hypothetical protein